jgi:hypothetical protein
MSSLSNAFFAVFGSLFIFSEEVIPIALSFKFKNFFYLEEFSKDFGHFHHRTFRCIQFLFLLRVRC